jgi:hypothetical protein
MNLLNEPNFSKLNRSLSNNNSSDKISLDGYFYTYRLTYTDPVTGEKYYYMGYRTGSQKKWAFLFGAENNNQ